MTNPLTGEEYVPNGGKEPSNMQVDLSAGHALHPGGFGQLDMRFVVLNLLDRTNQLRDGSGDGDGAPQYDTRRAAYFGISKPF